MFLIFLCLSFLSVLSIHVLKSTEKMNNLSNQQKEREREKEGSFNFKTALCDC